MNPQFERLDEVAQEYFKSLSNISKILGLTSQYLYNYKNRHRLGASLLAKLGSIGINVEYLKTGEGRKIDIELENLMIESQQCKLNLEEKIKVIDNLQKAVTPENKDYIQNKLEQLFKEQRETIERNRELEKLLDLKYMQLKMNSYNDPNDEDLDEIETTPIETEIIPESNLIFIYDLSPYARSGRISSIETLPKSNMKVQLNIEIKDEIFGMRVSGSMFENHRIYDGNIIILERARKAEEGQEVMYLSDKTIEIKIADEKKTENLIGIVKAVIQYR